jgi:LuxR family maltose regulon positive regulatory protein
MSVVAPLAKITRPRLAAVHQRTRLFDLLEGARQQGVATIVTGPPGAGKTTLVSSHIEFRNLRCIWYHLDAGDDDVATFFHFLGLAATNHRLVDSGVLPHLTPEFTFGLAGFSREYFRKLYATLKFPFVLVLDNYQEVPDGSQLHRVICSACEEMPDGGHVILISRHACHEALSRLRANHALTVLGPDVLSLTAEEAGCIAELQGVKLHADAAAALQAKVGGWAAGLTLALEANCRDKTEFPWASEPGEAVFEYFAGEVFQKIAPASRAMLIQCALLPKVTSSSAIELTGYQEAEDLLHDLARKNFFVTRHTGDTHFYQFHPLFRQFLLNHARKHLTFDELLSLQRRAAEISIAEGDLETAVELFGLVGDWHRMTAVTLDFAPMLMAQGRIATLSSWMKRLPEEQIQANPWLLYWRGISKAFSSPIESQAILEEAYRRFTITGDIAGLALSWSGLMDAIFHLYIDLRQMDRWIVEYETRLADQMAKLPPPIMARATLSLFVALSFRQPNHPGMPATVRVVREIIKTGNGHGLGPLFLLHLGSHHIWQGDHTEAEVVLGMFNTSPDLHHLQQPLHVIVGYLCEATFALHMGMEARCLNAVSEGLATAEKSGIRMFDSILLGHGAAISLNNSNVERADDFLARFERLAEELPFVDRSYYFALAAWRKVYAGQYALALQLFERSADTVETKGAPYFIAAFHLGFALLFHVCGKGDEAANHLTLGRAVGASIANKLIEYVYQLFSAYIAFDKGNSKEAMEHLRQGMRLGREHGYMHFFFFPPKVITLLCLQALEANIEPNYVRSLIERNGLVPDSSWAQSEAWPRAVRIYTLGRFTVVKDGEPLRFNGKAQKKPLELLKALIAFGGRNVPETKLQDVLWPDAEGDSAAQALATTLFRLRKLVGENLIERREGRLTLDSAVSWVDCWAFERLTNEGSSDEAIDLKKITQLYQGTFLDGEDDAAWAQPLRERLHKKFTELTNF